MNDEIRLDTAPGEAAPITILIQLRHETPKADVPIKKIWKALCIDDKAVKAFVLQIWLENCSFARNIASNGIEPVEANHRE